MIFAMFMVLILSGCGNQSIGPGLPPSENGDIICEDPPCLGRYLPSCTPAEMTWKTEEKILVITIHGMEKGRCHYTMAFDGIIGADCHFKLEDLQDGKVLNQMFGNKEGKDTIIAEACGSAS